MTLHTKQIVIRIFLARSVRKGLLSKLSRHRDLCGVIVGHNINDKVINRVITTSGERCRL